MAVVYSLSSLQRISDSSREYAEKMRKLQENIQLEWRRKVSQVHGQCMVSAWLVHGQCMVSACVSIVAKVLFPAVFSCLVLILPQSHVRRMFLVCLYQTPQIFSRYLSSIFW